MSKERNKIKKLLKEKNVSIYKLCKDTETPKTTVYDWIRGTSKQIGVTTYNKLLTHLKNA